MWSCDGSIQCQFSTASSPSHPQGCLHRFNRVLSMLESAGLRPNLDSYAAALECMGRGQACTKIIWR